MADVKNMKINKPYTVEWHSKIRGKIRKRCAGTISDDVLMMIHDGNIIPLVLRNKESMCVLTNVN